MPKGDEGAMLVHRSQSPSCASGACPHQTKSHLRNHLSISSFSKLSCTGFTQKVSPGRGVGKDTFKTKRPRVINNCFRLSSS